MVVAAAGQAVVVVVESAVAASVVEAGCTQDVVFAMAAPSSVAAAADIVEEVGVAAVVDTSAPSRHARLSHSDRGQYLQYSGSEYAQALGLPARAAE